MTLEYYLQTQSKRDNNFNVLRLSAAIAVIVAHSLSMYGHGRHWDFVRLGFGIGLGDVAVNVFFVISGFLVTRSWQSKRSLLAFGWARFIRIYPALAVSSILLVLVAGMFFSPLAFKDFLLLPSTLSYILKNSTMLPSIGAQLVLPFGVGDWDKDFNVSLWTLPHELQMYGLIALLGVVGALNRGWAVVGIALASLVLWAYTDISRFRLMFHFFAGASCVYYASRLQLDRRWLLAVLIVLLTTVLLSGPYSRYVLGVLTPFLVFWFSYVPNGRIRLFNRLGDYSYGTYIFAFPIQVVLFYYLGDALNFWTHFAITLSITFVLAIASWHSIEKKALAWPMPFTRAASYA